MASVVPPLMSEPEGCVMVEAVDERTLQAEAKATITEQGVEAEFAQGGTVHLREDHLGDLGSPRRSSG